MSSFPLTLPFDLSFNSVFQKAVSTQDMTSPISLLPCLVYVERSLTLCNTFFTRNFQLIFPILLRHHISNFQVCMY